MTSGKQPRTYNLKFNKTLFKKTLVADTRSALVGWFVALLLVAGGYELSVRELIPEWVFIIFVIVSLYLLVAPLWTLMNWLEFRRIHVKKKKTKNGLNA